ncbi:SRPBCC family protein [Streptosporangium sp. NBC_01755]|uniref:SRPBCC family protein n=1 Tax=unclassified Streptosporangium TaxID=2632669 RepID=UPI002DDC735D|nr:MULTISPECIES: SRPBCC family protein [unclassified Streptosporangium]WSA27555.1 SRPBCC family protein [Streptosporangium sp. NBC_01810]WSD00974.1 SRPBCC family protein [Streptosporangium sp. NBC_01755]
MGEGYEHTTHTLARALGWAGLGVGVARLAARFAASGAGRRAPGVEDSARARDAMAPTGVWGVFYPASPPGGRRPTSRGGTRVAGDIPGRIRPGLSTAGRTGRRRGRAMAVTAVAAGTAAALYTAVRARRHRQEKSEHGMNLHAAVTINRPREEVYRCWHDFENLPRFMAHLESVRVIGDGRSHWKARGPAKKAIEWEAVIVEDRSGELIAWRSVGKAAVANSGSVRFTDAPGERGTEVRVNLRYDPPGGKIGTAFARLLGEHPEQQVRDDLCRFKQVLETGEVVRSEGIPEGARALWQATQRPAQPAMSGSAS